MNAAPWVAWLVDAAIVVAALEAIVLLVSDGATRRGRFWRDHAANLGAGLCLMAGIRAAVAGAPWPWLVACLSGAGAMHLIDLRRRLAR